MEMSSDDEAYKNFIVVSGDDDKENTDSTNSATANRHRTKKEQYRRIVEFSDGKS